VFDLNGKKALITGASGGIGQEIAKALSNFGAEICISGRNEEKLTLLKDSLDSQCHIIRCDLSKEDDVINLVKEAEDCMGTIDVLINNAGITKDNIFLRMSDEEWDQVYKTNLYSTFKILKLVTKGMVKRRYGRIVNISSVVGVTGGAGQANYASSKAGIIAMTKSLSQEFATRNITLNCIAPGFIETNMTSGLDEKRKEAILRSIPANRFGLPEDLTSAVIFLVSEESSYITGQTIHINGGLYMN
jgi:3-oxoacyl-[acyl-carrier protein] reductase